MRKNTFVLRSFDACRVSKDKCIIVNGCLIIVFPIKKYK